MRDRRAGGATLPLLLLLAVLAGGGGWNYHRNMQAEAQVPRPYRNYGDAELSQLLDAYRSEVARLDDRYGQQTQRRADQRGGQLLDERVDDFERARKVSHQLRSLRAEASGQESILDQLQREQDLRAGDRSGWELHWKRLASF